MARRYQVEELLWLRNSPLITKPDKLPPIEEWMGPIPDPAVRQKNAISRDHNQNETTNRRPSLFETRHISRNSNSEDIVLGPPKTAFASASRIFGKGSIDATDRSSKFPDSDDTKNDRYNFRDKFFKDREVGDKEFDRRDNRLEGTNGRRNDREDWNHGRPRRNFGQVEQQDRRPRRNGEPDRWDNRDRERDQQDSVYDRGIRDKEGRYARRDVRGRHGTSWFRDEGAADAVEIEEDKPSVRSREWRRDRQLPDREWNRGTRLEQEPEWLDATEQDEPPKQARTQEDFQRWKESMKAGSAPPPQQQQAEEKKEPVPEQVTPPVQRAEAKHLEGEMFNTAFHMDTGLEKFFGLLGDAKSPQDAATPGSADSSKRDSASMKTGKSSRFAGFFSPPPENTGRESDARPQTDRPVSTDADQEGFQRILQMLGNSKSRDTTPRVDSSQQPRPPPLAQPEPTRPSPPALSSPPRDSVHHRQHEYMLVQDGAAPRNSMEPLISQNVPRDPQVQLRDRENLLRLMQQVKISPGPHQPHGNVQPQSGGHTPGILNVPDLLSRPQGIQKGSKNPTFLDDPAIANMHRPEPELNEHMRRPANGPPLGYFEEMPFLGGNAAAAGGRGAQGPAQPPMGLQRPPGFDQMPPPPGWAAQQLPLQQGGGGPSPLAPPPGIPAPSRGINPSFLSGPMPMHGGNMPPPSERHLERPPFPRVMSGSNSAGNFGPPPGMMPPPGYMNMNGPPHSAFPPMPHNPDAGMMNFAHAGHGQGNFGGGGNSGPSGPPSTSRHLLEMFAQANGGDGRGGMLGPGHYR